MTTVSGHAYPWDVLGDPSFVDRVREYGLSGVTLAAAYHSTRAATPLHPRHQIVDASHAALYRPVRASVWSGRRLAPAAPQWMTSPDPFETAAAELRSAGVPVTAWIVLTHSTRLGTACPDVAVTNCFGERYAYALCPAHEEVREYAATLAAEALHDVDVDGVSLEACGQLGLVHLGHHEKTDGAWSADAVRLLSICCCGACQAGWRRRGLDPGHVVSTLRDGVQNGTAVPDEDAVLATRQESTDALRMQVLAGLPAGVPVTLHAQPDPWATGPSPGLTPAAAGDVDALLVPAWPTTSASADLVARAAGKKTVDAYVTVLPPTEADALMGHVQRLREAGASRLSLYHLGLASRERQRLFPDIVRLLSASPA